MYIRRYKTLKAWNTWNEEKQESRRLELPAGYQRRLHLGPRSTWRTLPRNWSRCKRRKQGPKGVERSTWQPCTGSELAFCRPRSPPTFGQPRKLLPFEPIAFFVPRTQGGWTAGENRTFPVDDSQLLCTFLSLFLFLASCAPSILHQMPQYSTNIRSIVCYLFR